MSHPILQPEAYVAAGGVYFIDGHGVVRRLDISGAVRKVTTFPITSPSQAVSFVVSPDGKQLMATVLTYTITHPNPDPNGPAFTISGSWMLDIERAPDGGAARVVKHWQAGPDDSPGTTNGFHNLVPVAWDDQGPLAMADGDNAVQQDPVDGQHWAGGHLVRLGLDGVVGADQGPAGCDVISAVDDRGNYVCAAFGTPGLVFYRSLAGHIGWDVEPLPSAVMGGFAVSRDGEGLAMDGEVARQNGSIADLPPNFLTRGWLDDRTLIGLVTDANGSMGVYHLDTSKLEQWGFSGQFVGLMH